MNKVSFVFRWIMVCLIALSIPALLVMNGIQSRKYTDLERQISELEKKQADLIEQNKKLITDISLLSNTDRIEKIARDNLNMRPAETDEIVRVEMKDKSK
ncbi:MAG: septum formation initiator family protein [Treponema sp.]|nr:septum formation initiator family protein [Treponema sp.]